MNDQLKKAVEEIVNAYPAMLSPLKAEDAHDIVELSVNKGYKLGLETALEIYKK